jgi:hypothetical protein
MTLKTGKWKGAVTDEKDFGPLTSVSQDQIVNLELLDDI